MKRKTVRRTLQILIDLRGIPHSDSEAVEYASGLLEKLGEMESLILDEDDISVFWGSRLLKIIDTDEDWKLVKKRK